jgi:hypothetical protein
MPGNSICAQDVGEQIVFVLAHRMQAHGQTMRRLRHCRQNAGKQIAFLFPVARQAYQVVVWYA